jgi:hypothetical protein
VECFFLQRGNGDRVDGQTSSRRRTAQQQFKRRFQQQRFQ